jgi:hypothetical protein
MPNINITMRRVADNEVKAASPSLGFAKHDASIKDGVRYLRQSTGMTIVALPGVARWTATGVQEEHIEAARMRHGRLNVV